MLRAESLICGAGLRDPKPPSWATSPTPSGGEVGNLRITKATDHASATYNVSLKAQSLSAHRRNRCVHGEDGTAGSGGGGGGGRGGGRGRRRAAKRLQQAVLAAAATAAGAAAHAAREQKWGYSLYQTVSYKKYGCCDGDRGTEALMEAYADACEEDVDY